MRDFAGRDAGLLDRKGGSIQLDRVQHNGRRTRQHRAHSRNDRRIGDNRIDRDIGGTSGLELNFGHCCAQCPIRRHQNDCLFIVHRIHFITGVSDALRFTGGLDPCRGREPL